MLTIVQIDAPEDIDAVRALVREFTRWVFTIEPDAEAAPTFGPAVSRSGRMAPARSS